MPSDSGRSFTFRRQLGVSEFGEVYLATLRTQGMATEVAVKMLRIDVGQSAARILDEAAFLALLRHPGIVRVIDLVKLDGRLALVTEFMDGDDLGQVIDISGPLPVRAAMEVVARVADALNAAVSTPALDSAKPMALVHRNIQPTSVQLGPHGEVKLVDFGLARTDAMPRASETGAYQRIGAHRYRAPEAMLLGPPASAGDIWGLALTGFEAIAGEPVFADQSDADIVALFTEGDVAAFVLSRLRSLELPTNALDLLADMVEVEPEDRPTALEVMRRADDIADHSTGESLRRWALDRTVEERPVLAGFLDGKTLVEEELDATESAVPVSSHGQLEELLPGGISAPQFDEVTSPYGEASQSASEAVWANENTDASAEKTEPSGTPPPLEDAPSPAAESTAPAAVDSSGLPMFAVVGVLLLVVAAIAAGSFGIGWISRPDAPPVQAAGTPGLEQIPSAPAPAPPEPEPEAEPEPEVEPEPEGPEPEPEVAPEPRPRRPARKPLPTAPAESPPPPGPVPVEVSSSRRALISVDGTAKAYTPLSLTLPVGSHQIKAVLPGQPQSAQVRTIDVVADTPVKLAFEF